MYLTINPYFLYIIKNVPIDLKCDFLNATTKEFFMTKYEFPEAERKALEKLNIPFVIYQFIDKRVVTLLVTNGMCRIMGMKREDIVVLFDRDMYKDTHPDDKARVADAALKFAQGGDSYDCVYRTMSHILGDYAIIHAHGEHFFSDSGVMLSCTMYMVEGFGSDVENSVTEKMASNFKDMMSKESLIRDNFYDTLTGLPNMSYFLTLAEAGKKTIEEKGQTPAMIFFDMVGMKFFNEKYGLREGDNLLVSFSMILKKYFPNENCGRMGQDHFAVFTELDGVEEILKSIFEDAKYANKGRSLPVHVGIYSDDFENVTASSACDRAKIASDKTKGVYNSTFSYFDDFMKEAAAHQEYVLHTFEIAIENGWIQPYYQQIVRSVNGLVCDEEALARWIDPVKGMIPPNHFIYVLEDAKLIHKLDLYMLECVLRDLELTIEKGGTAVPVSINFSKYDFQLCDLVEEIKKRVEASTIGPELITIEITESVSSLEEEFVTTQIARFHEAGFKVWMDDFGSGFSSLNMLQKFDFDVLKFDMKFMREFGASRKNHIILTELVKMATKLGIETVVEGVETVEQVKFLREIGATKLQGFYFAKPVSMEEWLEIYGANIGNIIEDMEQSLYYEKIGRVNIVEPDVNADYNWTANEFFGQIPTGIVEFRKDSVAIMRYNNTYAKFLLKMGYVDETELGKELIVTNRWPREAFIDVIRKCVDNKNWVYFEEMHDSGLSIDVFLKYLGTNPVTKSVAIEVAIVNIANN